MSDYINQIEQLQKQVEQNKIEQAKLQEREKSLQEEKTKILEELRIYEISEGNIEVEIQKLETQIKEELEKCSNLIK